MAEITIEENIEDNMIDCTTLEQRPSIESAETVSREAEGDKGNFEGGKLREKDKKKLIEALKDHQCLWSTSHSEYKDKLKKISASKALASRFGLPMEELKKVLHSMRTSMTQEIKRSLENEGYVSKWKFFKSMEYLKPEIVKGFQNQTKVWTEEETETLIDFYRVNEFLWNHRVSCYKDREKRSMAMTKLQEILNNRTVEEIKSQWHSLRTIFEREYKRMMGSKRSGAGTDAVYTPTWKYFQSLQFTQHCNDLDESISTISSSCLDEDAEPHAKRLRKIKASKAEELNNVKIELWKEAINVVKSNDTESTDNENSELKSFGKLVEETLTRFNARHRAIARKKINDVLYEVEIGEGFNMMTQLRGNHMPVFSQFQCPDNRSPSPASSSCF